jgi:hypothetical protein
MPLSLRHWDRSLERATLTGLLPTDKITQRQQVTLPDQSHDGRVHLRDGPVSNKSIHTFERKSLTTKSQVMDQA